MTINGTPFTLRPVGILRYEGGRSGDGDCEYELDYLLEVVDDTNEIWATPADIVEAVTRGLQYSSSDPQLIPKPGDPLINTTPGLGSLSGRSYAEDALCSWEIDAEPHNVKQGERPVFWVVSYIFSNLGSASDYKIPQNGFSTGNYYGRPNPSSGQGNQDSFTRISVGTDGQQRLKDVTSKGCPIRTFSGNAVTAAEMMRNNSYMTVTIEKVLAFNSTFLTAPEGTYPNDVAAWFNFTGINNVIAAANWALGKVNYQPMWSFPARHVRFESFDSDIKYSASGQPYLEAVMTFKIAPPWLTKIPVRNVEYTRRTSYGFDEPVLPVATRVLDSSQFKQPGYSAGNGNEFLKAGPVTGSGDAGMTLQKYDYFAPMWPWYKIPSADIGSLATGDTADWYYISGYDSNFDTDLGPNDWAENPQGFSLDDVQAIMSRNGIINGVDQRLSWLSWTLWNPTRWVDVPNKMSDIWVRKAKADTLAGSATALETFPELAQAPGLMNPLSNPNLALRRLKSDQQLTDNNNQPFIPTAYNPDHPAWTNEIASYGSEGDITIPDEGIPIWTNTTATPNNFLKWPGFPVLPGQDPNEALVYPAIDEQMDLLNVLGLPDTIPL